MRSGLFVKAPLESLLDHLAAAASAEVRADSGEQGAEEPLILARQHCSQWSHFDTGDDEAAEVFLVELLAAEGTLRRAVRFRFNLEKQDFFLELVDNGRLLEGFRYAGGGWDAMDFSSEIRTVPLQDILDPEGFVRSSLREYGLDPTLPPAGPTLTARVAIGATGRRKSWLGALFGAAWWGD